jgi:formiminotetrahydrofolate cyclodeaminase
MTLSTKSVTALLEAFRSSDPTPGGGSAAALAGAVGASLLAMVAALPKPRASTEQDVERLRAAGTRSTELAKRLEGLIDRDSEAYELVMSAYRLPKGTDDEKAARSARIQEGLKAAIDAPLDVMRACAAGMAQAAVIVEHGNPNASSDVQVGLELMHAGLRGARLNVDINLGSVKDQAYVAAVTREIDRLSAEALKAFRSGRVLLADE